MPPEGNTLWIERKILWKGDSQLGFLHRCVFTLKASSWFANKRQNCAKQFEGLAEITFQIICCYTARRGQGMLLQKVLLVCHVASSPKCWKIGQAEEVERTMVLRFGFNTVGSLRNAWKGQQKKTCFSQRLITDWQFLASFPQRGQPAEILSSRIVNDARLNRFISVVASFLVQPWAPRKSALLRAIQMEII